MRSNYYPIGYYNWWFPGKWVLNGIVGAINPFNVFCERACTSCACRFARMLRRMRGWLTVRTWVCMRACVRARACVRVCARVYMCVCVWCGEGGRQEGE